MREVPRPTASRVRVPAALALTAATAVALVSAAAPATGADRAGKVLFTVTISGIDRDGTALSVSRGSVYGLNGISYLSGGSTAHVPAGNYIVAAPIWRPADGSTQTLVARKVHVTGNTHVTLNAVGAVPVNESISTGGVTQGPQTVELCLGSGTSFNSVTGYLVESPGTAYVKPMSSSALRTVYQTYWQGAGTQYDLAGEFSGGIPAHPVYHANPSAMARVHVELRDNENVTPLVAVLADYANCGDITEPASSLPTTYTDYRTPGSWNTNLDFGALPSPVQRDIFKPATYLAGHTYSDLFGSAVHGPGTVYPVIDGSNVTYSPGNLFSDPAVLTGFDCEGKATVNLKHGASLVKSQKLTFCGKVNFFSAHPANSGWYNMNATATRFNPGGGALPADLLSTKVTMGWHFHYSPVTGHAINAQAAPVTVTRFLPHGLSTGNYAFGGGTTTIKVQILRGGGQPVATPRYRLHPIKVQASTDDGLHWTTLAATPHGSYWIVHVSNPSSGFVSLRSTVTDVHGDSTTETILRAYLVVAV